MYTSAFPKLCWARRCAATSALSSAASPWTIAMPMPPPPATGLTMTGYPRRPATWRIASASLRGSLPCATGTPASAAARRAATLSPIRAMTSGGGPMNTSPASLICRAAAAFSANIPYPGWIASASAWRATSRMRGRFRYESAIFGPPTSWTSSAISAWGAPWSAREAMATVRIPSSRQARMIRTAISPRLATSTLRNTGIRLTFGLLHASIGFQSAYSAAMVAISPPMSISCPASTSTSETVPLCSDGIGISIFMDWSTAMGSPCLTFAPFLTTTLATRPGTGATTSTRLATLSPPLDDLCERYDIDFDGAEGVPNRAGDLGGIRRVPVHADAADREGEVGAVRGADLAFPDQADGPGGRGLWIPRLLGPLQDERAVRGIVQIDIAFGHEPDAHNLRRIGHRLPGEEENHLRIDLGHSLRHRPGVPVIRGRHDVHGAVRFHMLQTRPRASGKGPQRAGLIDDVVFHLFWGGGHPPPAKPHQIRE